MTATSLFTTGKVYAGIGSRDTPDDILAIMEEFAFQAARTGLRLHSGGAIGADRAFELGLVRSGQDNGDWIFLPWKGFGGREERVPTRFDIVITNTALVEQARAIAGHHHPKWDVLKDSVRTMMVRNTFQVLGPDLDRPVDFIVCWTADGGPSGGTGQAIRHAINLGIPVYNLKRADDLMAIRQAIATMRDR